MAGKISRGQFMQAVGKLLKELNNLHFFEDYSARLVEVQEERQGDKERSHYRHLNKWW